MRFKPEDRGDTILNSLPTGRGPGSPRPARRAIPRLRAAISKISARSINLVINGDFETGDLSGWVAPSGSYPEFATPAFHTDGNFSAQIAGYVYNPDTLTQQITTNQAGTDYRLKFDYYFQYTERGIADLLTVQWNGFGVFHTDNDADEGHWRHFETVVTGTGSDTLKFVATNDPGFIYVDSISLSAAPEPASWAMMVGGFGLVGGAMRARRKTAVSFG